MPKLCSPVSANGRCIIADWPFSTALRMPGATLELWWRPELQHVRDSRCQRAPEATTSDAEHFPLERLRCGRRLACEWQPDAAGTILVGQTPFGRCVGQRIVRRVFSTIERQGHVQWTIWRIRITSRPHRKNLRWWWHRHGSSARADPLAA